MNNKELNEAKSLISHAIHSVMATRAMEISQASDPEAVKNAIDEHIHNESIRYMDKYEGKQKQEILFLSILEIANSKEGAEAISEVITDGYHKRD